MIYNFVHYCNRIKISYIYRPEAQRERIAVKMEFETLRDGIIPDFKSDI